MELVMLMLPYDNFPLKLLVNGTLRFRANQFLFLNLNRQPINVTTTSLNGSYQ